MKLSLSSLAGGGTSKYDFEVLDAGVLYNILELVPLGDRVIIKDAEVFIDATRDLHLDSGGNTWIEEFTPDETRYVVGGKVTMTMEGQDVL